MWAALGAALAPANDCGRAAAASAVGIAVSWVAETFLALAVTDVFSRSGRVRSSVLPSRPAYETAFDVDSQFAKPLAEGLIASGIDVL